MAPKAATKSAAPKKSAPASHGTYQDMIKTAIINLKERNGSSRQTLKKYVLANNDLGSVTDATFTSRFNMALSRGSETGVFQRPKGTSGPVKLGKGKASNGTESKEAAKPKAPASTAKPKTAAKPKETPAPRKLTVMKTPVAKPAAKKTSTSTTKPKKTTAPSEEKKTTTVLSKTKSGRVTKSQAPAAKPATKKAASTQKKTAPPKKAASPKKAAAKK